MTADVPLVTVIIPTYNSAATLEQCLQSVKAQTYPHLEVLVVDNHSQDNTVEIAKKLAEVIQAGPERSAQVNAGAYSARGKYLYRIDGDMLLEPGVVQACVEAIEKEGYDAIAVPNRSRGEGYWARVRTLERDTYLDDPLIVAARFWRRSAFEAVGGLDETLISCEDYDLHNRLVSAGYRIGRISATEYHLGEADSLWDYAAQSFYYGPSVFRYLRKHPRRGVKQMIPLRSSYLRHWRSLAKQPHLTLGLVLLKLVQYSSAALGIALSSLGLVIERGRVAYQAVAGLLLVLFSLWALTSSLPDLVIRHGFPASWAAIIAGVAVWQWLSRQRARHLGISLPAALLSTSLAFAPLLLIQILNPRQADTAHLETWRMASILSAAFSLSWLTYLAPINLAIPMQKKPVKAWSGHLVLVVLLAASLAFTAFFTLSGLNLLHNFSLRSSDLAAIDQALWATATQGTGSSLSALLYSSIYERSVFALEAAPAILLLLPFYKLGLGSAGFLLFIQALGLAAGALALYRLGKDRIGDLPALLVSLGYLGFFLTVRLAQGRFSMLTWSIPLLLFALDAYQRRRIPHFYLFSALALTCGIDTAWALAALGLYLIVARHDRLHGFITLGLGISWLGMIAAAFAPLFGGTASEAVGWAELSTDSTPFSARLGWLLRPEALSYVWKLLMPTALLPLLGAPMLLPAAPRLLFNLLVGNPSAVSLNGRYETIMLPFLFAAVIAGIDWLATTAYRRSWAPPQLAATVLVLITSLCGLLLFEPGFTSRISSHISLQESAILEAGHSLIQEIPPQASVAVQSPFAPSLAHRLQLTILPRAVDPDYILFDVFHPNRGPVPQVYQESLMRAFQNPLYGLRMYDYGYLLFERDLDPSTKKAALVSGTLPNIQYAQRVELDSTIAYLGFDLSTTHLQAGEQVYLTHYWQSILPTPNHYLQFTAYPGAQRFEQIAFGAYSPEQWNPGDVVIHRQLISFPDLPDGDEYEIAIGLWFGEGEPRLQSPDQLLGQDVIRIASLSVSNSEYQIHPWYVQIPEGNP